MSSSVQLALGARAPDFALPAPAGGSYTLQDFAASKALLVAFICNHCPFVRHILDGQVQFARDYAPRGVAVVAISSNDIAARPEDGPQQMAELAARKAFGFPYLYDESQAVAKAYGAVCTPDLFLFDQARQLRYRGQFDASRPGNRLPVTGQDLRAATDALLAGRPIPEQQPSVGCSIKWKAAAR